MFQKIKNGFSCLHRFVLHVISTPRLVEGGEISPPKSSSSRLTRRDSWSRDDRNTQPIITLTCDFGEAFAVAQMELVVHGICPRAKFVLLSNNVHEYSIVEGAFIIQNGYKFAAYGSVHIGIVDPGVGSARRGVAIHTSSGWFVGPDNGLLYPAAKEGGIQEIYEISEEFFGSITNTFHGRDVFVKVAAQIIAGDDISLFLKKSDMPLQRLNHKEYEILHIDPYGNIKVNIKVEKYKNSRYIVLKLDNSDINIPIVRTYSDVEIGSVLAYSGSHDTLELAINQGNAAEILGYKVGDILSIFMA